MIKFIEHTEPSYAAAAAAAAAAAYAENGNYQEALLNFLKEFVK